MSLRQFAYYLCYRQQTPLYIQLPSAERFNLELSVTVCFIINKIKVQSLYIALQCLD
jgi:hypothetical protein